MLKTCIYDIEKHIRAFFWGWFEIKQNMKTIAWSSICLLKEYGGLGIRSIADIVEAVLLREVWDIASKRDSV